MRLDTAEKLAGAVLLFHAGGPWTEGRTKLWRELTGQNVATTKVLYDLACEFLDEDDAASFMRSR